MPTDHSGFGGDARALQPHRHQPGDRGDVDDLFRTMLAHHAGGRLADGKQPIPIDVQQPVPLFAGEFVDRHPVRHRVHTRVVDDNVQPPEAAHRFIDDGGDLPVQIDFHRCRFPV